MTHKIKDFAAHFKADANSTDGTFEAIVSVFGNVDSTGDVVMPGAFTATLAAWAEKGDPIPVIWSHQWGNPDAHIGVVVEAKELPAGDPALPPSAPDGGLWIKGQLDIEDNLGKKVHKLLKGRRVTQFSFAYDVVTAGWGERDGKQIYELRALDIFEVGPTLIGANRATELLDAKATLTPDEVAALRSLIAGQKANEPAKSETPPTAPPVPGPAEPRLSPLAVLIATTTTTPEE